MKVKINEKIKGIDGVQPVISPDTKVELTLRDVCVSSILTPMQDDDQKSKYEKYELFKKLRDAKVEVELTAAEIVLIQKCIGKFQPALILGQCFEMLEK
jgi:hypothetical protein